MFVMFSVASSQDQYVDKKTQNKFQSYLLLGLTGFTFLKVLGSQRFIRLTGMLSHAIDYLAGNQCQPTKVQHLNKL